MKTKNIFRMLLVAATLLMGANNVKADDYIYYNYDKETFTGLTSTSVIRVNCTRTSNDYWEFDLITGANESPDFTDWNSNTTWSGNKWGSTWGYDSNSHRGFLLDDNHFDLKCTSSTVSKLTASGLKITTKGLTVTSVVIVGAAGLQEGENVVSTEVKDCSFGNGISFSSNLFQGATAGNTVRIYGDFSNSNWKTEFMYDDNGWKKVSIPEWGNNYQANASTTTVKSNNNGTYVEFTLTNDNLPSIKNHSTLIVQGEYFQVQKVVIYVAPTSTKTTPTLSFGQTTVFNITYGDSFTGPTATCDVSGLEITYESNNTSVAEVTTYFGVVTIKGVGQAIITAKTQASDDYNAAEVSYTINVSAPQPTISFSPDEVNFVFGGTYEAPTVTKTPADANVTYSSSNTNVAAIDGNGNVVPVGAGTAIITGTLANTTVSATYTLNVTAPTRTGAAWTGAAWLGSYGRADYGGGTQPTIPTTDFQSANVGDMIRFYGKLGPLGVDHNTDKGKDFIWRVEVHGNNWAELADINSADSNNSTDNANFQKGYFDMVINNDNISNLKNSGNLTLNGHNLTITAVELISASAPAKQDVTLTFSPSTATATMGEAFTAPTPTATANGETVTGLSISYSSSNTSVATVNASTGAVTLVAPGTTTITASFSGNDNYNAATASYTLTVNAAAPSDEDWIDVKDGNIEYYGYRTYVTPQAVDLSRSVNVEAYYATGLNSARTEVEFTQVTGVCASGVPLLLKATVTGASEYKLLKSSATGTAPTDNKLQAGQGYEVSGDDKYVLTKHSGQVVFAEVNILGALVPSGYAYLDLNGSNARGRLSIRLNGESTGISTIQNDERNLDGTIYNLRGQRVENPTKGLYIINGKKVVIK